MLFKGGVHSRYTDKVTGTHVILTKDTLDSIRTGLGHSEARPDIEQYLPQIRRAVEDPTTVRRSLTKPKRTCHYACYVGDHKHRNQHMKVAIEKAWYGNMEIVSAYFVENINTSEPEIWSK